MDLKETGWEGMNQINVSQDCDKWQAVLKVVMNFWVQNKRGISGLAEELSGSQEALSSMELVS